jgi:hypothetical protein
MADETAACDPAARRGRDGEPPGRWGAGWLGLVARSLRSPVQRDARPERDPGRQRDDDDKT